MTYHVQPVELTEQERQLKQACLSAAEQMELDPAVCGFWDLVQLRKAMLPVIEQTVGADRHLLRAQGNARNRHACSVPLDRFSLRYYPSAAYSVEEYELVAQLRGSSILFINEERIDLQQGEMILLLPGTWQRWAVLSDDSLRQSVYIQPSTFRDMEAVQQQEGELFEFLRTVTAGRRRLVYRMYRVDVAEDPWLFQDWIQNLYGEPYDQFQPLRESSVLQLLFSYLESGRYGSVETVVSSVYMDSANELLSYMEDHLATITRRELAEAFHYSERQVSRIIEDRVGNSFSKYLQLVRLRRIASLLTLTNMPVGEIAEACGYHNDTYFYNLFRSRFGMSPTEYRERM